MNVIKKIVIIFGSFLVIGGLIIVGLLYYDFVLYKVLRLENEWNINLFNSIKFEYYLKKVYIDGSIYYYVFIIISEFIEIMFIKGDDISKEDFEILFISVMEGFGIILGKINIFFEFYLDFNENYKFLLLNGVGGGGKRYRYFYLVFFFEIKRIFICN